MKYATVEDVIAIFPHPILPTVQGELEYKQFMPSGSYYKQTPGQLTPIWVEELWYIWDSLSQMHLTPWSPRRQRLDLPFG
jgi:hypothetical protein